MPIRHFGKTGKTWTFSTTRVAFPNLLSCCTSRNIITVEKIKCAVDVHKCKADDFASVTMEKHIFRSGSWSVYNPSAACESLLWIGLRLRNSSDGFVIIWPKCISNGSRLLGQLTDWTTLGWTWIVSSKLFLLLEASLNLHSYLKWISSMLIWFPYFTLLWFVNLVKGTCSMPPIYNQFGKREHRHSANFNGDN